MVPLSVDLLLVDLSIVEWFSRCPSRVGLLGKRAVVWGEAHWGEARWGEARCAEARWGEQFGASRFWVGRSAIWWGVVLLGRRDWGGIVLLGRILVANGAKFGGEWGEIWWRTSVANGANGGEFLGYDSDDACLGPGGVRGEVRI